MGFRYRKSINLGKGFRVNISKSGIGYSYGVKGARITKTANGRTRQTLSIPGTGISYVSESGSQKPTNNVKESTQKFSEAVDNQILKILTLEYMMKQSKKRKNGI